MKKWIALGIVGIVVLWFFGAYRGYVSGREQTTAQWSQVENAYQRRADLVPNLVETVRGAADFERSTFEAVTEARAAATSLRVNPEDLTPEKLREFEAAQAKLSVALGRLLAVAENYPQLRATEAFRDLMTQLEGTENRIAVERNRYNERAREYNTAIQQPPGSFLIAGPFGFTKKPYFEAKQGADTPPPVKFDFGRKGG